MLSTDPLNYTSPDQVSAYLRDLGIDEINSSALVDLVMKVITSSVYLDSITHNLAERSIHVIFGEESGEDDVYLKRIEYKIMHSPLNINPPLEKEELAITPQSFSDRCDYIQKIFTLNAPPAHFEKEIPEPVLEEIGDSLDEILESHPDFTIADTVGKNGICFLEKSDGLYFSVRFKAKPEGEGKFMHNILPTYIFRKLF